MDAKELRRMGTWRSIEDWSAWMQDVALDILAEIWDEMLDEFSDEQEGMS